MKHVLTLFFSLLPVTVWAAPIHVTLRASATVAANGDGFFTLSQVADLSGGSKDAQTRLASVVVGRVPLSGETRTLTGGDVCLKLRQAGLHPGTDAVVDGAGQSLVSATSVSAAPVLQAAAPASGKEEPVSGTAPISEATLIHIGDPVAIVVQDGPLSVTARGQAREAGRVGQSIRVHREGVMSDLRATVLDSQTVQLEL